MKIIKYILFLIIYFLDIMVLRHFARDLWVHINHGAVKYLMESIFENTPEVFIVYYALLTSITFSILLFSIPKIKSSPYRAFLLLMLPLAYFLLCAFVLPNI